MDNVIRVQDAHHGGSVPQSPDFPLLPQPEPQVEIVNDAQAAVLTTGRLSVRVEKGAEWRMDFRALNSSTSKRVARLLGYQSFAGQWGRTVDGIFFYREVSPATYGR
jgi:alpha-D-xyloside xylohydrolase